MARRVEDSCTLYSLSETATANGLNLYGYLHYVFSRPAERETSGDWHSPLSQKLAAADINNAEFAGVEPN